jgi:hypothetical protein
MTTSAAVAPPPVPRSKLKLVFFVVFGLLTVLVTVMKNQGFFDPTSPVAQHFAPGLGFLLVHGFFGMVALALGALSCPTAFARVISRCIKLGYVYCRERFHRRAMAIMLDPDRNRLASRRHDRTSGAGLMITTAIALYLRAQRQPRAAPPLDDPQLSFAMVFTVARLIVLHPADPRDGRCRR